MNKYNFIFAILVFVFVACSPSEAKLPQENPTIIFNTEKKEFLQDNNNMISFTINNPSELYLSCTVTIFFETENGATKELCVVTLDSTKKAIKSNTQLEFEYVNNREKIKTTNFYFSIKEEGLLKFCVNVGMDDINVVNSQEYKITPNIDPLVTDIFFSLAHNDEGEIIDDVYCVNYSAKDEDGNIVSSYVKSIYYVNENGEEKELIIDDNENFNLVYSGKYKVVIAIKDNSSNFFSLFTSFVNFDKNIFPEIYLSGESIANINEEIKVVLNISDNDQSSKFFNVEVKLGYDNKQIYKENFINGQQIILSFSKASANVFPSNSSILNYISSEYSKYAENPYYDVSNLDVDSIDNDLEDVFPVIFYVTDESENTTAQLYFCNIYDYKFVGAIYNKDSKNKVIFIHFYLQKLFQC